MTNQSGSNSNCCSLLSPSSSRNFGLNPKTLVHFLRLLNSLQRLGSEEEKKKRWKRPNPPSGPGCCCCCCCCCCCGCWPSSASPTPTSADILCHFCCSIISSSLNDFVSCFPLSLLWWAHFSFFHSLSHNMPQKSSLMMNGLGSKWSRDEQEVDTVGRAREGSNSSSFSKCTVSPYFLRSLAREFGFPLNFYSPILFVPFHPVRTHLFSPPPAFGEQQATAVRSFRLKHTHTEDITYDYVQCRLLSLSPFIQHTRARRSTQTYARPWKEIHSTAQSVCGRFFRQETIIAQAESKTLRPFL